MQSLVQVVRFEEWHDIHVKSMDFSVEKSFLFTAISQDLAESKV